jgi:predicted transcriptional regulator
MNKKRQVKSERMHVRLSSDLKNQLLEYAHNENIKPSAVMQMAVSLFLSRDIEDESLLIAKMSAIDERLTKFADTADLAYQYIMDFFQYNFLFFPPLPEDTRTLKIRFAGGAMEYKKFLTMFRRRLATMPKLQEAILGDMLTEQAKSENPKEGIS